MIQIVPRTGCRVAVLGTGGTIAGRASSADDNIGYTAGQVGVAELLGGVDAPEGATLVCEQVAQIDSKDMAFAIWRDLALRCAHWLAQADVAGVVVTHGTDTLEETAFFLQAVLAPSKPVVLTCAMRPASALAPDGPQNMRDALSLVTTASASGVLVVCAGTAHSALDVQKVHTYRLDAFDSGDCGPVAYIEEGVVRCLRAWPASSTQKAQALREALTRVTRWPRVEILTSHAESRGLLLDAMVKERLAGSAEAAHGVVLACTGNGTLHHELEAAAQRAQAHGIAVVRATRCTQGRILPRADDVLRDAGGQTPVKARIALMLEMLENAAIGP